MKRIKLKILSLLILMAFSCSSCAKEEIAGAQAQVKLIEKDVDDKNHSLDPKDTINSLQFNSQLLDTGDILILSRNESKSVEGSMLSLTEGDSERKFQRVVQMLNAVEADKTFIEQITARLKNNRQFKQDTFTLPLVDQNGNMHEFNLLSHTDSQFYTLNYRYKSSK